MALPGFLPDRCQFQYPFRKPDGGGGFETVYKDAFPQRGKLIMETGRERLQAGRLESAFAGRLRIKASAQARTIEASWRVIVNGIVHKILTVDNSDARSMWIFLTVERGSGS